MATKRTARKTSGGGRGSPEAVAKRRAARQLNTLLAANRSRAGIDGRTENRRKRLVKELCEGRKGQPLKPIDFVSHVNELLEMGESLASLKKQGVKPRKTEASPAIMEIVQQTQDAYGFRPEAWKMIGIKLESASSGRRGGRKKKG